MMPIAVVASQPRRFSRQDRSEMPLTHRRQQLSKAWALLKPGAATAHIFINDHHLDKAQSAGTLGQGLLAAPAFLMMTGLIAG